LTYYLDRFINKTTFVIIYCFFSYTFLWFRCLCNYLKFLFYCPIPANYEIPYVLLIMLYVYLLAKLEMIIIIFILSPRSYDFSDCSLRIGCRGTFGQRNVCALCIDCGTLSERAYSVSATRSKQLRKQN